MLTKAIKTITVLIYLLRIFTYKSIIKFTFTAQEREKAAEIATSFV